MKRINAKRRLLFLLELIIRLKVRHSTLEFFRCVIQKHNIIHEVRCEHTTHTNPVIMVKLWLIVGGTVLNLKLNYIKSQIVKF